MSSSSRHNNVLPEIFCIRENIKDFKVYENTIEESEETLNIPINVLTPVSEITRTMLILTETPHQKIKYIFIRKWNGKHYRSCQWKYKGPYLQTEIGTIIPEVELFNHDDNILPYNNIIIKPCFTGV